MAKNIPGYVWCASSNRYYRAPPEGSFVNLPPASNPNQGKQAELEAKIDPTHKVLADLEYGLKMSEQSGTTKFNAYDSLLASRFTSDRFKFHRNIFIENLLNFRGARLIESVCQHLAVLPARDLLIGAWKNESCCAISQIDVRGLLAPSVTSYKLVANNNIGNFQNFVIDSIQPIFEIDNKTDEADLVYLFCLLRSFDNRREETCLQIYGLKELEHTPPNNENISVSIEFPRPYYCCDIYLNEKLAMGGDSNIFLFELGKQNRRIILRDNNFLRIKDKCIVNIIKFSEDGKRFCAGTSKGNLEVFTTASGEYYTVHLNCGPIVDLAWLNENELIVSAHNNNLLRIDLRSCGANKRPVLKFDSHANSSKRIKFSIDSCHQTLTSCGDDNCTRIWSLASGNLIRLFDFADLCNKVNSKCYTDDYLLEADQLAGVPVVAQPEPQPARVAAQRPVAQRPVAHHPPKASCLKHYARPPNEQYQVVSSSQWRCLKKPKVLMLGSISDSVDLYFDG